MGCVPLYLKTHSYGEYVFDHSWASTHSRCGIAYYPKLQSCVPFTPVTGNRLLIKPGLSAAAVTKALAKALMEITGRPMYQLDFCSLQHAMPVVGAPTVMQQVGLISKPSVRHPVLQISLQCPASI